MKVKEAIKITEGFTRTSKMPGLSYSLPAWECKTGSKLRKIKAAFVPAVMRSRVIIPDIQPSSVHNIEDSKQ